jgi:murein peptide amidase A
MQTRLLSRTSLGLPILAHDFGLENKTRVLILGGVHGDEIEGVVCARGLLDRFIHDFPYKIQLTLITELNPEGVLNKTRGNSNSVDLNRNLPTKDWSAEIKNPRYNPGPSPLSELENKALLEELKNNPDLIVSLHSWNPILNINGDCLAEAEVLSQMTGYKIDTDIGYPTPGSLGTYAGLERQIPTLTYEIERGQDLDQVLKMHVPAICEMLKTTEKRFA